MGQVIHKHFGSLPYFYFKNRFTFLLFFNFFSLIKTKAFLKNSSSNLRENAAYEHRAVVTWQLISWKREPNRLHTEQIQRKTWRKMTQNISEAYQVLILIADLQFPEVRGNFSFPQKFYLCTCLKKQKLFFNSSLIYERENPAYEH